MHADLGALPARYHRAFNDRDWDVWREVFDEDVELLVDGMSFHGVGAAVAYRVGSVSQFSGLHIDSESIVAESGDTVVTEIRLVNGDPAGGNYFIVAEALTNVAKHACADRAAVTAYVEDGTLRVLVRDDGLGGARPDGSGLVGLADRVAVLDGQLRVESPADGGTIVAADIPLAARFAAVPDQRA